MRAALVLPALDEERAVAAVVRGFHAFVAEGLLEEIVVADNGSGDRTAERARAAGATVVSAARRGYGSACLAGLSYLARRSSGPPGLVAFADADGSSLPAELPDLVRPLARAEADMAIGARVPDRVESGALTVPQRWGNRLAVTLIHAVHGHRYSDLGPFRAATWAALERLQMRDPDYGWTVEMQVKALKAGLRVVEVPVTCRRRIGVSKISGTARGVIGAGTKILATIAIESMRPLPRPGRAEDSRGELAVR